MKRFVRYQNGNYTVTIDLQNGTKIRENDLDFFRADYPESMDIKICNKCDLGCPQCHENSTPDGKCGDIMSESFIDKLHPYTELACLDGNTMVHSEYGSVEIKNLKIGDKIYDSEHRLRTVTNIQKTTKKSVRLHGKKGVHIRCSEDHPFISNGVQVQAKNLVNKKIDNLSTFTENQNDEFIIDMAELIHEANESLIGSRGGKLIDENTVRLRNSTKHIPRFINLNNDLMWLYGIFVAEGSCKGLTLHINETDFATKIENVWKNTFGLNVSVYKNEAKKSMAIELQSPTLIEDFFVNEMQVGVGARNKSLKYLYSINNKEFIRQALLGLFDGDGCIRERSNKYGGINYCASLKTTSKYLAYDVSYLLAKWFGIYATIHHGMSKVRKFENRVLQSSDYYSVEFYGYDNCMKIFYDQKNFVKPIQMQHQAKSISKIYTISEESSCELYDITLDSGTHIFPIDGYLLTHNCGGGNPLEHPQLVPFLEKCQRLNLIPSMTVNQVHFEKHKNFLKALVDKKLIYGLGISLVNGDEDFITKVKEFPNAVIHVINGMSADPNELMRLAHHNLKILILGYKEFRRGADHYSVANELIEKKKQNLYDALPQIINEGWFEVVSFDNLAIKQLDAQRLMSAEDWDQFYMGDDGQDGNMTSASMYVDMVNREFAKNSTSTERYPLEDDIVTMFEKLRTN